MIKLFAILAISLILTSTSIAKSPVSIQGNYRCPQGIEVVVTYTDATIRFPKIGLLEAPHSRTIEKASFYGEGDHVELGITEMPYGDIIVTVFEEPANVNSRSNDIICLKD